MLNYIFGSPKRKSRSLGSVLERGRVRAEDFGQSRTFLLRHSSPECWNPRVCNCEAKLVAYLAYFRIYLVQGKDRLTPEFGPCNGFRADPDDPSQESEDPSCTYVVATPKCYLSDSSTSSCVLVRYWTSYCSRGYYWTRLCQILKSCCTV